MGRPGQVGSVRTGNPANIGDIDGGRGMWGSQVGGLLEKQGVNRWQSESEKPHFNVKKTAI